MKIFHFALINSEVQPLLRHIHSSNTATILYHKQHGIWIFEFICAFVLLPFAMNNTKYVWMKLNNLQVYNQCQWEKLSQMLTLLLKAFKCYVIRKRNQNEVPLCIFYPMTSQNRIVLPIKRCVNCEAYLIDCSNLDMAIITLIGTESLQSRQVLQRKSWSVNPLLIYCCPWKASLFIDRSSSNIRSYKLENLQFASSSISFSALSLLLNAPGHCDSDNDTKCVFVFCVCLKYFPCRRRNYWRLCLNKYFRTTNLWITRFIRMHDPSFSWQRKKYNNTSVLTTQGNNVQCPHLHSHGNTTS